MKKNIYFILLVLIILSGCKSNPLIQTHGIAYLEKREKLIIVNEFNKNDTIKILGQPATKSMSNEDLWIYIERTKTRGRIYKLGKNYIHKNNILVLEFDKFGILSKKVFYDIDDMKNIKFAEAITENDIKKENFIYSFLSSIRTKMDSRKK